MTVFRAAVSASDDVAGSVWRPKLDGRQGQRRTLRITPITAGIIDLARVCCLDGELTGGDAAGPDWAEIQGSSFYCPPMACSSIHQVRLFNQVRLQAMAVQ
jgi:hypothetical protein